MTTPAYSKLRRALVEASAETGRLGLSPGRSGNLSVRAGDGFLITPSGVSCAAVRPSQVVYLGMDGAHRDDQLPSSEWRMHRDIYAHRPLARAVVHTHSLHATALSCLRKDVPAFHYMIAITLGSSLRCARYATVGTAVLSRNALQALEERNACLLANHGMICFASSPAAALSLAQEVETLCNQYVIACQLGTPSVLGAREMDRVLERFQTYGTPPGAERVMGSKGRNVKLRNV